MKSQSWMNRNSGSRYGLCFMTAGDPLVCRNVFRCGYEHILAHQIWHIFSSCVLSSQSKAPLCTGVSVSPPQSVSFLLRCSPGFFFCPVGEKAKRHLLLVYILQHGNYSTCCLLALTLQPWADSWTPADINNSKGTQPSRHYPAYLVCVCVCKQPCVCPPVHHNFPSL